MGVLYFAGVCFATAVLAAVIGFAGMLPDGLDIWSQGAFVVLLSLSLLIVLFGGPAGERPRR